MKRNVGFTLVELLVTITIMVILLTLTVVSLRANQASARDEKRKTDVSIIAQQLENYFKSGSSTSSSKLPPVGSLASFHTMPIHVHPAQLAVFNPGDSYTAGQYPPTAFMDTEAGIKTTLRDLDPKTLRAPDVATTDPVSLTVATSISQPTPDSNTYVYQPIKGDGTLCTSAADECRKFIIFYKLETDATVQQLASKHQ